MDEKRYVVKEQSLKNLADQVRIKAGTPDTLYDIDDMSAAISTLGMPELEELNVTENGEYTPTKYGYSRVTVDVQPPREEINITENGEYTPTSYGYSKVTVDVQPTLEELTVTENGIYTPTEYGYSRVTVNCPVPPPDEAFIITGDCERRFFGWDWFIENYGNKIVTKDISNLADSFKNFRGKEIPFVINIKDCNELTTLFSGSKLEVCPKIRGTFQTIRMPLLISGFGLTRVRDLNDLFEPEMFDYIEQLKITSSYYAQYSITLVNCLSMRTIPTWWYKLRLNKESTAPPTSSTIFNSAFNSCYVLDEVKDLQVWTCAKPFTSNMFTDTFSYAHRLKDITFETNNGVPVVANWKNQTINLGPNYSVGYTLSSPNNIIGYNSGITADKEVKDDATYQALKNDPDWWTISSAYSRYNHDSAVRTINSLPDTSACLAANGGTNTIKFTAAAGSKTDGGAISSLTPEEIAVATAKGWSVVYV